MTLNSFAARYASTLFSESLYILIPRTLPKTSTLLLYTEREVIFTIYGFSLEYLWEVARSDPVIYWTNWKLFSDLHHWAKHQFTSYSE